MPADEKQALPPMPTVSQNKELADSVANLSPAEKVATLLVTLGPAAASNILKNIEDEGEVEFLAMQVAALKKVPTPILHTILNEFMVIFQASGFVTSGGVNYARELLEQAYGGGRADIILKRLLAGLKTNPFDFFNNADPTQLVTSFQNENPQLIALVLSYLKPPNAASLLGGLPPELQAEVALRIAEMDRTNPEVLREVERILERKFSTVMSTDFSMAGGVEALADILNNSDRSTEKSILDSLEIKDLEMAERVRDLMFVFEDIVKLDDRSVQRVLRETETKDLALALKGADDTVRDKILKNMSERAAALLIDDMEYLGPVKARDVSEKQTYIVSIIRALESAGEITIARSEDEDDQLIE